MPFDNTIDKPQAEFINWITTAEAAYDGISGEYTKARSYIENEQAPTVIPGNKQYVQFNLITDRVNRGIGDLVSSEMTPALTGGGRINEPKRILFQDILEENMFQESILPTVGSYFYGEGFCGLKFMYNPRRVSKYGIGKPMIEVLIPGELLLDPTSRHGDHSDDIFRIHKSQVPLQYAKERWPEKSKEITKSVASDKGAETGIEFVDLYEIEYRITEITTREIQGIDVQIEREVYYMTTYANRVVELEPPSPTGYPTFRLIPVIHTPRTSQRGNYPFGLYAILGNLQDSLNVTYSVMLDAVKASIKQTVIARGADTEEVTQAKDELAKVNGFINFKNVAARVDVVTGNPIPPALVQWADLIRFVMDEVIGSYAPNRGQVTGELSGKAIQGLQSAGRLPDLAKKKHIEKAFTHLSACIFHAMENAKVIPHPRS